MIVIWKKPNNTYYYKDIKGFYDSYEVGKINQNNHEIVLVIESTYKKDKLSKRLLFNYISHLKSLYKRM